MSVVELWGDRYNVQRPSEQNDQLSARQIAEAYGVSERTARRHKAAGTLPSAQRVKAWRGGKVITVPRASPLRGTHKPGLAARELTRALQAIRRAAFAVDAGAEDLRLAWQIIDEATSVADRWRSAICK